MTQKIIAVGSRNTFIIEINFNFVTLKKLKENPSLPFVLFFFVSALGLFISSSDKFRSSLIKSRCSMMEKSVMSEDKKEEEQYLLTI